MRKHLDLAQELRMDSLVSFWELSNRESLFENRTWNRNGIDSSIFIDLLSFYVISPYIDTKSINIKSIRFRFHFYSQKVILCLQFNCSENCSILIGKGHFPESHKNPSAALGPNLSVFSCL